MEPVPVELSRCVNLLNYRTEPVRMNKWTKYLFRAPYPSGDYKTNILQLRFFGGQ